MEKKRDALKQNIVSHTGEIKRLTDERDEKTGSLYDDMAKLQKEIDATEKPFDNSIRALKKRKTDDSNALHKVEHELALKSWEKRIPVGNDETKEWFTVHKRSVLDTKHIWAVIVKRAPKVKSAKGYVTIAMADDRTTPDFKAYVVFDPIGNVFATMTMSPAKHIGDTCRVSAVMIKGKDAKAEIGLATYDPKKPVATFMDAVEAAIKTP